jgi:tetratricopeptide (TPR) repeat protein
MQSAISVLLSLRRREAVMFGIINFRYIAYRAESLGKKFSEEFLIEPDTAKKLAQHSLSFLSDKYRQVRYQDLGINEITKTPDCDSQEFLEWTLLREKFREAKRDKNYQQIIDTCHSIIKLDERARFIEIMTPLFYKDAGRAYLKLGEKQKALHHFQTAKSQFIEYRHNHKLSHPDDWLRDINFIEKTIQKLI